MSFDSFKNKVNALIARVDGITVNFSEDPEKGKFFANCSDGTTIIGNSSILKVTIKWGSGHTASAMI